jgi:hypothetical protein
MAEKGFIPKITGVGLDYSFPVDFSLLSSLLYYSTVKCGALVFNIAEFCANGFK